MSLPAPSSAASSRSAPACFSGRPSADRQPPGSRRAASRGPAQSQRSWQSTKYAAFQNRSSADARVETAVNAASIVWDWADGPSWISAEDDNSEAAITEELHTLEETSASVTARQFKSKPLKINRDLLLYRARLSRQAAQRAADPAQRSALLKEAESRLRRCLTMDATDGRAYVSLGKVLLSQRRIEEARALYEEGCTATGGDNPYIWQAWATLESRQGNVSRARKLYDAATVADKTHAAAWHGWGLLEKREGNYERARDLWRMGIENTRARANPYLFQSLAVLAAELRLTEEARHWFRQGTSTLQGGASHALWQAWALMEARQGDRSLVRVYFKRGLQANPRGRYIYLAWALWEKEQGNRKNARVLLATGHERNKRDAAILQAWALLEEEDGNLEEARKLLARGARADPSHIYVWQAWGMLEYRAGNLERARDLFQQGVWADPASPDVALVFQAWGVLERDQGNTRLARELFKCAVKADKRSAPSWLAWAALEEAQGALARANELRNYSLQERIDIVPPSRFTTLPGDTPLAAVFRNIGRWFSSAEKRQADDGEQSSGAQQQSSTPDAVPYRERARLESSELLLPELTGDER